MKRALCLAALLFAFTLAAPNPSTACYDKCTGTPGTCRTCETGFNVTYQVCLQTAPCRCITYAVPSYQCDGLNAASNGAAPSFLEPAAKEKPARPAAAVELSFLAPLRNGLPPCRPEPPGRRRPLPVRGPGAHGRGSG